MPECYTAAAPDVWPVSFMSTCCRTVLPLSFTEEIRTLEGVSVAENANVKGLKCAVRARVRWAALVSLPASRRLPVVLLFDLCSVSGAGRKWRVVWSLCMWYQHPIVHQSLTLASSSLLFCVSGLVCVCVCVCVLERRVEAFVQKLDIFFFFFFDSLTVCSTSKNRSEMIWKYFRVKKCWRKISCENVSVNNFVKLILVHRNWLYIVQICCPEHNLMFDH